MFCSIINRPAYGFDIPMLAFSVHDVPELQFSTGAMNPPVAYRPREEFCGGSRNRDRVYYSGLFLLLFFFFRPR